MGYYEVRHATYPYLHTKKLIIHLLPQVPCQLCGVPFKISRLRTQFEPRAAAWSGRSEYSSALEDTENCETEGCKLAFRHHNPEDQTEKELSKDGRFDHFMDCVPSGVDRDGNEVSLKTWLTVIGEQSDNDTGCWGPNSEDTRGGTYQEWFEEETKDGRKNPHSRTRSFRFSQEESADMIEHIAGVDCCQNNGFNGNDVLAEEMRLCNTAQYIVEANGRFHRDIDWTSEPDDEEFERENTYLLSGLADRTGGLEGDCTTYPERHGLKGGDMSPNEYDGFDKGDLVFHPHCLEIYKRAAALRLGSAELTNVPAFADWWNSDGRVNSPPCHPSVSGCGGQWFEHSSGCEFIAANPLQIPALTAIFEAARRPDDFDAMNLSPFGEKETNGTNVNSDIFGKLPNELRDMVLSSLGSKDIANLRIASRNFRHLSITLWRELIEKEMPWVWEVWTERPYPFISCTTRPELEAHDKAVKDRIQAAQGLGDEKKSKEMERIAREESRFRESRAVHHLSRLNTDWHYLYCRLAREWKNIKGLRNRERIWESAEHIVRRIAHPDEDPKSAMEAHEKAFPFRNT
jgi:hypothetical protein